MKNPLLAFIIFILVVGGLFAMSSLYVVRETDQVIITQFQGAVGDPITEPGLYVKVPFIQKVNRLEKRILEWDGTPSPQGMTTRDKTYIIVDSFARWRISDPLLYFERLNDTRSALSRLDDILGSETRTTISNHNLVEVVRSTKGREAVQSSVVKESISDALTEELSDELRDQLTQEVEKPAGDKDVDGIRAIDSDSGLKPIQFGRSKLEKEIQERAEVKLAELGIELLDIRFKRINYRQEVEQKIYEQMITERQRVAERFRSEGDEMAKHIEGLMQVELAQIESEAYKEVQIIRGRADAEATRIYAEAYNQSPQASAFYEFTRTMEVYKDLIDKDTTMILSTDSDLFQYLKGVEPQFRKEFEMPNFSNDDVPLFLRPN